MKYFFTFLLFLSLGCTPLKQAKVQPDAQPDARPDAGFPYDAELVGC